MPKDVSSSYKKVFPRNGGVQVKVRKKLKNLNENFLSSKKEQAVKPAPLLTKTMAEHVSESGSDRSTSPMPRIQYDLASTKKFDSPMEQSKQKFSTITSNKPSPSQFLQQAHQMRNSRQTIA